MSLGARTGGVKPGKWSCVKSLPHVWLLAVSQYPWHHFHGIKCYYLENSDVPVYWLKPQWVKTLEPAARPVHENYWSDLRCLSEGLISLFFNPPHLAFYQFSHLLPIFSSRPRNPVDENAINRFLSFEFHWKQNVVYEQSGDKMDDITHISGGRINTETILSSNSATAHFNWHAVIKGHFSSLN